MRPRPLTLLETLQKKAAEKARLVISSITYSELRLGAERSTASSKHNGVIDDFCHRLNAIVAWDAAAADHYARIQAKLLTAGTPIGTNDAMIAGHALSTGATLVTNNQRHFERVSGLALENWAELR
jgi:tRNA(fMet)-specific endonuclease VapC